MLNFLSPSEIVRLCRGTMTPLPDYCWRVAERLAAGANETPGTVADTGAMFDLVKREMRRYALEHPGEIADYIDDNIERGMTHENSLD